MSIVLGVDAGNSKTIALVAREDGRILGWGRSGCGDIYGTHADVALDALQAAAHGAMRAAGVTSDALASIVLSAAGADWPEDFDTIRDGAMARGLDSAGRPPIVFNDAIGGLRAGSPDGSGVAVVCGTGTAIGARAIDGRLWHSSFWQGPQGGAYLGKAAFDAVVRAELGAGPATALTKAMLAHLGAQTVEEALHACTARGQPHPPMKLLARVLLDVAEGGDVLARQMVIEHGRALGDYALVAARKVALANEPFYLVLAGGVMRHPSSLMRDALIERVREFAPHAQPIRSDFEPAVGAVMLALDAAGVIFDGTVRDRLRQTLPDGSLFTT